MNAAGYIRISTKDQSIYSLGYQEKSIRDYCARNGLTLMELFTDNGKSSYTFDRPDWKKLELFIKNNRQVNYLIIFDYDRFSRNIAEAILKIKDLHGRFGIKVLTTGDPVDLDFNDPMNFMMRAFKLMMGESELWRIRKRTNESKVASTLAGRPWGKAPFGYINARDENGKAIFIIDELKADVVRKMFSMYLSGATFERVRQYVKSCGYSLNGNATMQRMLSNCIYAGLIRVAAKGVEKYNKGLHSAIIDEKTFYAAKAKVITKKKVSTYFTNEEMYLKGALHCWCGKLLTTSNPRGRHGKHFWYYICSDHRQHFLAKRLHEKFDALLYHLSFSPDEIQWFRNQLMIKVDEYFDGKESRVYLLKKELAEIKQSISNTEQRFLLSDQISVETYNRLISEMNVRKINAEHELSQLNETRSSYVDKIEIVLERITSLDKIFYTLSVEKRNQLIDYLFGGVLYYTPNSFRTPFASFLVQTKTSVLQELQLLKIEKPDVKLSGFPLLGGSGVKNRTILQTAFELVEILAA